MARRIQNRPGIERQGPTVIPLVRRAASAFVRSSAVNRALRALAVARGHRLVLVYHRLGPPVPPGCEIVPSVPADVFRKHLQALREVTEIVTLGNVLEKSGGRRAESALSTRPAVAITFDDDLASHMSEALPVLRHFQAPATFFLSGRALHADEPYWFQYLEALLIARGVRQTAALLGMPDAQPGDVLAACEGSAQARKRIRELARGLPVPDLLQPSEMASLAAAGMTVGFHTVDHEILPTLDDEHLHDALSRGRAELSAASGADVRYFAYPHGKTDGRVSAAVRAAGFDAAFTGHPRPLRDTDDRHRVGRWEPGPLNVDELILKLAVRLHRAAPVDANERR